MLGDWGYDPNAGCGSDDCILGPNCQPDVSSLMEATFSELGDVKFVLNLGDSFYISGVTSVDDPKWESTWRTKYSDALRNVPWYGVYGNHDYGEEACACRTSDDECVQTQYKMEGWHMPALNYNVILDDMKLEIIALDMNLLDQGSISNYQSCTSLQENLQRSKDQAKQLLETRLVDPTGPNHVLIISHYPTYMWPNDAQDMLDLIQSSTKSISVYGGHTHSTAMCEGLDSCEAPFSEPLSPQKTYLAGGGGGWFSEHDGQGKFGIIAGLVQSDGAIEHQAKILPKDECQESCLAGDAGDQFCAP